MSETMSGNDLGATALAVLPANDGAQESAVARTYQQVREMALTFKIRPGERVNETEVARKLGVSRTPLREALNRLVSEGILTFVPTKGFFRIEVKPREIFELYQIRVALEQAGGDLAVQHASGEKIKKLATFATDFMAQSDADAAEADSGLRPDIVAYDEMFHEMLAEMSGNRQLVLMLQSVNVRIRPVRQVGLSQDRLGIYQREHMEIVQALWRREAGLLRSLLQQHIAYRFDEVENEVRRLYGTIYVG